MLRAPAGPPAPDKPPTTALNPPELGEIEAGAACDVPADARPAD